jgi:hypothetical protein
MAVVATSESFLSVAFSSCRVTSIIQQAIKPIFFAN